MLPGRFHKTSLAAACFAKAAATLDQLSASSSTLTLRSRSWFEPFICLRTIQISVTELEGSNSKPLLRQTCIQIGWNPFKFISDTLVLSLHVPLLFHRRRMYVKKPQVSQVIFYKLFLFVCHFLTRSWAWTTMTLLDRYQ